jgi:hypothetical protein
MNSLKCPNCENDVKETANFVLRLSRRTGFIRKAQRELRPPENAEHFLKLARV